MASRDLAAADGRVDEIDKLRALLFRPESERIAGVEAQVERLESRVGDARALEQATAEILVQAIRRVEAAQHPQLASAVAPVVVAAIRSEIVNSKDMMVEALYPITGRLVASGIAVAFKELTERINLRLEALTSSRHWQMRLQSWKTGRPLAEIALQDAHGATMLRAFLLERGSGKMLAHWRAGGGEDSNPELVSGMIAAISEFAANVLSERHGELRTLDLGASTVYLRASARLVLAVEMLGDLGSQGQRRLEGGFLALVDRHERRKAIESGDLAGLAAPVEGRVSPSALSGRSRWALALCLAIAALAWLLYDPVMRGRKEAAIRAAYDAGLSAHPALAAYPLNLAIDSKARTVSMRGLAPDSKGVAELEAAVEGAAAPYQFAAQVDVVADAAELRAARADAAQRADALGARLDGLDFEIAALARRDAGFRQDDAAALAALSSQGAAALTAAGAQAAPPEAPQAADRSDADAALARLRSEAAALRGEVGRLRADSERTAAQASQRLGDQARQMDSLAARLGALAERPTPAPAVAADPTAPPPPLRETVRGYAIFFSAGVAYADLAAAGATLDGLAAALRQNDERLRVVGYADDVGGAVVVAELARARAAQVVQALVARGVAATRLAALGRGAQSPIAEFGAPGHERNRRVEFELAFAGEPRP